MPRRTHKPETPNQRHKKRNARKRKPATERNARLHQYARVTALRGG